MAHFNKVMLIGNLTRDPLLRQLPGTQTKAAEFGLAASRRYRTSAGEERDEVCFVDCTAFGRLAEVAGQYLRKGRQVFLEGRLRYEAWEDKQGARHNRLSVVVDNLQLLGPRQEAPAPAATAAPKPQLQQAEIPF